MNYQTEANEIIKMKDFDLQERKRLADTGQLFEGYNKEMEKVHIENARQLERIINELGWPTKEKVGKHARDAAALIIQHAISLPDFQRTCLKYIKDAIEKDQEEKRHYAFLYDRICFNERRPQKFGTQFDWDEKGQMSPWRIENPEAVNALRKEYGLNSIEEETATIRKRIRYSNETPPDNFEARLQEIYEWSRETGWLK